MQVPPILPEWLAEEESEQHAAPGTGILIATGISLAFWAAVAAAWFW